MRYASGEYYQGYWYNGQRNGEGEMIYGPGGNNRYVGTWLNSKKHGCGTFYFENGDMFCGEWADGSMHGTGQYMFADGDTFVGNYLNGKKNHGDYHFLNGFTRYSGYWRDELFDGKGRTWYSNSEKYSGSWMQGMRHGRDSRYDWPSGSRFDGAFEYDQMRKGLYRSANELGEYEGPFVDGFRYGIGHARFRDGSVYAGDFQNDLMSGHGTYKFP